MRVFVAAKAAQPDLVQVLGVFSSPEKADQASEKAHWGSWELFEREIDSPISPELSDQGCGFTKQ